MTARGQADFAAAHGFDTWCMDNAGYGRSDKSRPINFDIANGADDLAAGIAPSLLGPQELGAFTRTEHEMWGRVVRKTGATIN